jgi:mevalonate kinase
MLTGEYFVLDGAKSLAFPTKYGQKMTIKSARGSDLGWKSFDNEGNCWFESSISLYDFSPVKTNNEEVSESLRQLLRNAVRLNSEFLNNWKAFKVETHLEFPRDWGLGSSSTLTHMMAEWADVNPFLLHFKISNGSGYDVACAAADGPITYEYSGDSLHFEEVDFDPSFKKNLYFVHLKEKQSSKEALDYYFKKVKAKKSTAKELTQLTDEILTTKKLEDFQKILCTHEEIVSKTLKRTTIKEERFSDYWGCVKSLGAWGGDFCLVSSTENEAKTKKYFSDKGYDVVIPFEDMIINE